MLQQHKDFPVPGLFQANSPFAAARDMIDLSWSNYPIIHMSFGPHSRSRRFAHEAPSPRNLRFMFCWLRWFSDDVCQFYGGHLVERSWFYQRIFNKSWAGKKHHLRWRWIRSVSGFFWWQNWLNLMLVIPGEYGLPALARVTQFIF